MATKKKNGRPKKEIDYDLVERLGKIFCTQEEIASILNISSRTLVRDDEFCQTYKKAIHNAKSSLRRFQFGLAEKGNATMCIWLGKQYLNQADKIETDSELSKDEVNTLREIAKSEIQNKL